MSLEGVEISRAWINEGKSDTRLFVLCCVEKEGELVNEMPNRVRLLLCSTIGSAWHILSSNLKPFLEVLDLLGLVFEILMIEMLNHEVEDRKTLLHRFKGVSTPIAEVLSINRRVHSLVVEMKNMRIVLVPMHTSVPPSNELGGKGGDDAPS